MELRKHNEDFQKHNRATGSGGNLTAEQVQHDILWRRLKPVQCHGRELPVVVVGFKGSPAATFGGSSEELQLNRPIRPYSTVRLMFLVPIDNSKIETGDGRRTRQRLRLHFADVAGAVVDGDLQFGGKASAPLKYFQADAVKRPIQDHPFFDEVHHREAASIGSLINEATHRFPEADSGVIVTPISGTLSLVRNDLDLDVTVNGDVIVRIALGDADAIEFEKTSGDVTQGQVIGRLKRATGYLRAKFDHGKPMIDYIGGDVLSASRRSVHMQFVLGAMTRMLDYSEALWSGQNLPQETFRPLEDRFPKLLLELTTEQVKEWIQLGWQPNATFKQRLLKAISPDALETDSGLHVRAPIDGRLVVNREEGFYRRLEFVGDHKRVLIVPDCANIAAVTDADGNCDLPVTAGQIIGDYAPRAYYASYEEFVDVVGADKAVKICDAFFESQLVRPGDKNWSGAGVCVEAILAGEALAGLATGRWLDFSAMAEWYDPQTGTYLCPAIPFDMERHGLQHKVSDVVYDFTPLGSRFVSLRQTLAPKVEKKRRRRRRRSGNKPGAGAQFDASSPVLPDASRSEELSPVTDA